MFPSPPDGAHGLPVGLHRGRHPTGFKDRRDELASDYAAVETEP